MPSPRLAVLAGAGLLALALTSCTGGDGDDSSGAPPAITTDVDITSPTTTTQHRQPIRRHAHPPTTTATGGPDQTTAPASAAELGESLRFGGLEVRALEYREAGYRGATGTGTRVDVVAVEECAESGPATVRHQTWRLVDSDGRTLGVAGGKMVGGHPTEDLPQPLAAGECLTTMLAIGVPADSTAVAVQDGPDAIWVLAG